MPRPRRRITFTEGAVRFNYRVAGIALEGQRVLLHRAERDTFWSLPGGRVELGEPAETALAREMREELGAEVRVRRLLWVVDNFFTHEGSDYHELALYFLMAFASGAGHGVGGAVQTFEGDEEGLRLIFQWHALAELERLPLYPSFLRRGLAALPAAPVYLAHTDVEDLRLL